MSFAVYLLDAVPVAGPFPTRTQAEEHLVRLRTLYDGPEMMPLRFTVAPSETPAFAPRLRIVGPEPEPVG